MATLIKLVIAISHWMTQNDISSNWNISVIEDEPISNAELLGLGKVVEMLFNFLTSEGLVSPLAIAINGAWGSGKTSLIKTVQKRLEKNGFNSVFFDAWKYEFSDPAAALFYVIAKTLGLNKRERSNDIKSILSIALDIFAKKYTGMSVQEMKEHFEKGISNTEILNDKLQNMISKYNIERTVVLIDDLDRCSLQNVLAVLDSLKLFLAIRNFVFVIALDMDKVKLAWSHRYGNAASTDEFRYLEKIFQIDINIPRPTSKQVADYINFLNPNIPQTFIDLISITTIKNPRSIKRLMNIISFRGTAAKNYPVNFEVAFLWTILEELIGRREASNLYHELGGSKEFFNFLVYASSIHFGSADNTDEKRAKALLQLKDRQPSESYLDHLVGKLRQELSLYLIKSSKILEQFKNEDRNKMIKAIDEVVSFSLSD
jgi:hypothetical protein